MKWLSLFKPKPKPYYRFSQGNLYRLDLQYFSDDDKDKDKDKEDTPEWAKKIISLLEQKPKEQDKEQDKEKEIQVPPPNPPATEKDADKDKEEDKEKEQEKTKKSLLSFLW